MTSLAVLAMVLLFLPFGEVELVASVASFAALLAFVAVNIAVIVLRLREPAHKRPFRVPLAVGSIPVLPVLGAASALVMLTQFEPLV